ncbi:MAG TPA: phytoene/squalene synthase family protein, partial [Xanthomonadaceae bacterium]|nr:phytoene/squalene synthase family protein [Xanthomonadaceae bacterium]
ASALLAERLLHHPDGAVPLQLLAAGEARAGQAWAAALLDAWPAGAPVARARRLHALLQRARLGQLARGVAPTPMPPWRTLWRSWRAARRDRHG